MIYFLLLKSISQNGLFFKCLCGFRMFSCVQNYLFKNAFKRFSVVSEMLFDDYFVISHDEILVDMGGWYIIRVHVLLLSGLLLPLCLYSL